MTMPHMMNCAHMDDGWCIPCVRERIESMEGKIAVRDAHIDALQAKLVDAEKRCERMVGHVVALRNALDSAFDIGLSHDQHCSGKEWAGTGDCQCDMRSVRMAANKALLDSEHDAALAAEKEASGA